MESLEGRRRSLGEECEEGRVRVGGMEEELRKAHDEIRLLQTQVSGVCVCVCVCGVSVW